MAESIDEFLGAPFVRSARTLDGPAIVEDWPGEEPTVGVAATTVSDTLRPSFGNRWERGDGLAGMKLALASGLGFSDPVIFLVGCASEENIYEDIPWTFLHGRASTRRIAFVIGLLSRVRGSLFGGCGGHYSGNGRGCISVV